MGLALRAPMTKVYGAGHRGDKKAEGRIFLELYHSKTAAFKGHGTFRFCHI